MTMHWPRHWITAGVLAGALGCSSPGVFECQSNDHCSANGEAGTCQPSGYCSFDDSSCASSQRYGQYAPAALAHSCVPAEGGTTADPVPDPSSSEALDDATQPDSTTTRADTSSGDPVLPPATDSAATSTGMLEDDSSGGDTGSTCPSFADDFEDGVIDPAWNIAHPDDASEVGGQLVMEMTPAVTNDATGVQLFDVDLSTATIELELGSLPMHYASQLSLVLEGDGGDQVSIVVQLAVLSLRHGPGGNPEQLSSVELDPTAHHWIRFSIAEPYVMYEVSSDGIDWSTIFELEVAWSLSQSTIHVLGTNWDVLPEVQTLSVETFRMCTW